MLAAAAPGQAVVVSLPQTITQNGSYFGINNSTVTRPLPQLPGATGSSAYGLSDVTSAGGRTDAVDGFAGITVNGTAFNQPNNQVDLTTTGAGTFLTTLSPANIGGINTSLDYFFAASGPTTMRAFGTFTNTTGSALTANIAYGGELGCDEDCTIEATSSGGGSFNSALDRFFITSDDGAADNDPFITFVRFGPGGQLASSTPAVPGIESFGRLDLFADIWTLNLAPGETKSLLWFTSFNDSLANGLAGTSVFNNFSTLNSAGLLSGLSSSQLNQTVNWVLSSPPTTTPEPSSLLGLGTLLGLGLLSKRCKKKD